MDAIRHAGLPAAGEWSLDELEELEERLEAEAWLPGEGEPQDACLWACECFEVHL